MKFLLTTKALRDYERLSDSIQKRIDKQLTLLLRNPHHPSLRTKKYDESRRIWQIRVSKNYRLYFLIDYDIYKIVTITAHSK